MTYVPSSFVVSHRTLSRVRGQGRPTQLETLQRIAFVSSPE